MCVCVCVCVCGVYIYTHTLIFFFYKSAIKYIQSLLNFTFMNYFRDFIYIYNYVFILNYFISKLMKK